MLHQLDIELYNKIILVLKIKKILIIHDGINNKYKIKIIFYTKLKTHKIKE